MQDYRFMLILKKQFFITKKCLTIYNYDENGITSKYKKFSKFWWKKEMKHLNT